MKTDKNKKVGKYYEHKPKFEFKASLSKDRKYWIFRKIETDIVPTSYLDAIKADAGRADIEATDVQPTCDSKKVAKRDDNSN